METKIIVDGNQFLIYPSNYYTENEILMFQKLYFFQICNSMVLLVQ
jgi:hypothetical protein